MKNHLQDQNSLFYFAQLATWPEFTQMLPTDINTLNPRQNGRHFPDNIFKYIFVNEKKMFFYWYFIEVCS